jgi:formylglycine-generating enzyme required for sulfatase activity
MQFLRDETMNPKYHSEMNTNMNMKVTMRTIFWCSWIVYFCSSVAIAASAWPYAGYLDDSSGQPYSGNVAMKFVIFESTSSSNVSVWSNDMSNLGVLQEPALSVSVLVSNGNFAVGLGDVRISNMSALSSQHFTGSELSLRVWMDNGTGGFDAIVPDRELTVVPMAFRSFDQLALSTVAYSGNYSDLSEKPNLFSGNYSDLVGIPSAFSGNYSDLSGLPNLFSGNYSDLSGLPDLFSGNYNDLVGKPSLHNISISGNYYELSIKPSFANVAFSGNYEDMLGGIISSDHLPAMVGDQGTGGRAGLVPAPQAGDGTKFLKGDGTWVSIGGSGGGDMFKATYDSNDDGKVAFAENADTLSGVTPSAIGKSVLASADESAARGILGLGTAATSAVGDFATKVHQHSASDMMGLSSVAVSGNYNDLLGKPILATVTHSGNFMDLVGVPTAISGNYADLVGKPSFSTVATTGSYDDLSSKPSFSTVAMTGSYDDLSSKPSLSTVATSGRFSDLIDVPGGFSGNYNDLDGIPVLSSVATSGNYTDLINKPSLANVAVSGNYADLLNSPSLSTVAMTGSYDDLSSKPSLSTVATSGSFSDLIDVPGGFSGNYNDLDGIPVLSSVATSGNYTDLINKPSLANVAVSGNYADLANAPSLSTVAMTGSYGDLSGTPLLSSIATSGNYNDLSYKPSLSEVATSGNYADLTGVPSFSSVASSGNYEDLLGRPNLEHLVGDYRVDGNTILAGNLHLEGDFYADQLPRSMSGNLSLSSNLLPATDNLQLGSLDQSYRSIFSREMTLVSSNQLMSGTISLDAGDNLIFSKQNGDVIGLEPLIKTLPDGSIGLDGKLIFQSEGVANTLLTSSGNRLQYQRDDGKTYTLDRGALEDLDIQSVAENATIGGQTVVLASAESGDITLTLDSADQYSGKMVLVKKTGGTGVVTIKPNASFFQGGITQVKLGDSGDIQNFIRLMSDGTQWLILDRPVFSKTVNSDIYAVQSTNTMSDYSNVVAYSNNQIFIGRKGSFTGNTIYVDIFEAGELVGQLKRTGVDESVDVIGLDVFEDHAVFINGSNGDLYLFEKIGVAWSYVKTIAGSFNAPVAVTSVYMCAKANSEIKVYSHDPSASSALYEYDYNDFNDANPSEFAPWMKGYKDNSLLLKSQNIIKHLKHFNSLDSVVVVSDSFDTAILVDDNLWVSEASNKKRIHLYAFDSLSWRDNYYDSPDGLDFGGAIKGGLNALLVPGSSLRYFHYSSLEWTLSSSNFSPSITNLIALEEQDGQLWLYKLSGTNLNVESLESTKSTEIIIQNQETSSKSLSFTNSLGSKVINLSATTEGLFIENYNNGDPGRVLTTSNGVPDRGMQLDIASDKIIFKDATKSGVQLVQDFNQFEINASNGSKMQINSSDNTILLGKKTSGFSWKRTGDYADSKFGSEEYYLRFNENTKNLDTVGYTLNLTLEAEGDFKVDRKDSPESYSVFKITPGSNNDPTVNIGANVIAESVKNSLGTLEKPFGSFYLGGENMDNSHLTFISDNTRLPTLHLSAGKALEQEALLVTSSSDVGPERSLVTFSNDVMSGNSIHLLTLNQSGNGDALRVVNAGNVVFRIDRHGKFENESMNKSGNSFAILANDLTSGSGLYVSSSSANIDSRDLVRFENTNTASANAVILSLIQSGNGDVLRVQNEMDETQLYITKNGLLSANTIQVEHELLVLGESFYSGNSWFGGNLYPSQANIALGSNTISFGQAYVEQVNLNQIMLTPQGNVSANISSAMVYVNHKGQLLYADPSGNMFLLNPFETSGNTESLVEQETGAVNIKGDFSSSNLMVADDAFKVTFDEDKDVDAGGNVSAINKATVMKFLDIIEVRKDDNSKLNSYKQLDVDLETSGTKLNLTADDISIFSGNILVKNPVMGNILLELVEGKMDIKKVGIFSDSDSTANYSFGGGSISAGPNSFIGGGTSNDISGKSSAILASTVSKVGSASGGPYLKYPYLNSNSVILGSLYASVSGTTYVSSIISSGNSFMQNAPYSSIIASESSNVLSGNSFMIASQDSSISGEYSSVLSSSKSSVQGRHSSIFSSSMSSVQGENSIVIGGEQNLIHSKNTLVSGSQIFTSANAHHTFVWGGEHGNYDGSLSSPVASNEIEAPNQFLIYPFYENEEGRVGIGTHEPEKRLHVKGSSLIETSANTESVLALKANHPIDGAILSIDSKAKAQSLFELKNATGQSANLITLIQNGEGDYIQAGDDFTLSKGGHLTLAGNLNVAGNLVYTNTTQSVEFLLDQKDAFEINTRKNIAAINEDPDWKAGIDFTIGDNLVSLSSGNNIDVGNRIFEIKGESSAEPIFEVKSGKGITVRASEDGSTALEVIGDSNATSKIFVAKSDSDVEKELVLIKSNGDMVIEPSATSGSALTVKTSNTSSDNQSIALSYNAVNFFSVSNDGQTKLSPSVDVEDLFHILASSSQTKNILNISKDSEPQMILDSLGQLALGKATADEMLDMSGNAIIGGNLTLGENVMLSKGFRYILPSGNGGIVLREDLELLFQLVGDNVLLGGANLDLGNSGNAFQNFYLTGLGEMGSANVLGVLDVAGNAMLKHELELSGNAVLLGQLEVSGNSSLMSEVEISGNAKLLGELEVSGNTQLLSEVEISGNTNLLGTLTVASNLMLAGDEFLPSHGNVNLGNSDNRFAQLYLGSANATKSRLDFNSDNTSLPTLLLSAGNGLMSEALLVTSSSNSGPERSLVTFANEAVGSENIHVLTLRQSGNGDALRVMNGDNVVFRVDRDGQTHLAGNATSATNLNVTGVITAQELQLSGNLSVPQLAVAGMDFPVADGTSGQVLTTDGGGNLSWTNKDATSGGGSTRSYFTVSSNTTASASGVYLVDSSSADVALTLPDASGYAGQSIVVKKLVDANVVKVWTDVDDSNCNSPSFSGFVLSTSAFDKPYAEFFSNGSSWIMLERTDGIASANEVNDVTIDASHQYLVVDVSGGSGASCYPYESFVSAPDLTGAGNLEFKTNKIVLKRIPAGSFIMGDQDGGGSSNELPTHTVNITGDFWAGVFEVTQQQWLNVVGSYPTGAQDYNNSGDNTDPVHNVSWQDIRGASGTYDWPNSTSMDSSSFMGLLQAKTGLTFDLPTEAQWEYTAKAGTSTIWSYGNTADGDYMWYISNNAPIGTKGVGGKLANPWGLFDMHGNVWEWCRDWYGSSYYSSSPSDNPPGPTSGSYRVVRGGGWYSSASYPRSAHRSYFTPTLRLNDIGFRLFTRPE